MVVDRYRDRVGLRIKKAKVGFPLMCGNCWTNCVWGMLLEDVKVV